MTTEHKLTADGAAIVAPSHHWIAIDKHTPRGASMWLINKNAGVAQKGVYTNGETFFTHWFPLPTFRKNT